MKPKKNKQSLSGLKKTPQRVGNEHTNSESNFGQFSGNQISKQNSAANVFDTPQIRLDKMLKDSPTSNHKNPLGLSKQYSQSFNSEDASHFKSQVVLIKQQLQRSEENNLSLQQKIEKQKKDKNEQKEKIFQLSIDKNDLQKQVENILLDIVDYERKFEAMKLDISDYTRQIQMLEMQSQQKLNLVDREVSARPLPNTFEQANQTEFLLSNTKKDPLQLLNEEQDQDQNISSNFSQKSYHPPNTNQSHNITIINNKQDMRLLLGKARDYEQISLQLQHEINDHKRMLKDNQDRVQKNQQDQHDYKKKIKKRESKIIKLKQINSKLEKDKLELKVRLDEANLKNQELRIKMEARLQEKEFKIISLKNRIKHVNQPSSGMLTPIPIMNTTNLSNNKLINQQELYNMINSIIKQQIQGQDNSVNISKRQQDNLMKQRAKSHDQPYKNENIVSFYDNDSPFTNNIDEPKIMSGVQNNMIFYGQGENPSFSLNGNNELFQSTIKNEIYNSPSNTPNVKHHNYKQSQVNSHRQENSTEIQEIFNSSLKRINNELGTIKDVNTRVSSFILETQPQMKQIVSNQNHVHHRKPPHQSQIKPKSSKLVYKYRQEDQKRDYTYEDSLQSQIEERDINLKHFHMIDNQDEVSNISNIFVEQRKIIDKKNRTDSLGNYEFKDGNILIPNQRKIQSLLNTQTFRQSNSITQNTPRSIRNTQINELHLFNNANQNQEKEQNYSIFYDFKPAFENSNYTNNSQINNTITKIKNFRNKIAPTKYETQTQSLNNSIKNPMQHVRLHSNLMTRDNDLDTVSPSEKSDVLNDYNRNEILQRFAEEGQMNTSSSAGNSYRRKHQQKGLTNAKQKRTEPIKEFLLSNNVRYEDFRGKNSMSNKQNNGIQYIPYQQKNEDNIPNQRTIQVSNQQYLMNLQSSCTADGSKSTLSNYSLKLEDLKRRYGRLN